MRFLLSMFERKENESDDIGGARRTLSAFSFFKRNALRVVKKGKTLSNMYTR